MSIITLCLFLIVFGFNIFRYGLKTKFMKWTNNWSLDDEKIK